jgi:hypothetical protein
MSILNYVRSLAPVIERRELLNQLDQLQDEYDETLSPLVADVRDALSAFPTKSTLAGKMDDTLRRTVNYRGQSLAMILDSLDNMRSNFEIVKKEIRSLFSIQFTNTALTFDRANMLKFVEAMNFYTRYGRKYLLFVVASEAALVGKSTPTRWSPAETDWVMTNMAQFALLYPAMSLSGQELRQRLNKASNASIDPETFELATRSLSAMQLDPLAIDGFSPQQNPFMLLGKYLAEYRVAQYQIAREEYYGLQLRLQELRELREQKPASPVIQKQIQAYEKRISEYEYKLELIEEKAGL